MTKELFFFLAALVPFFLLLLLLLFLCPSRRPDLHIAVCGGEEVDARDPRGLLDRDEQHPLWFVESQGRLLPSRGELDLEAPRENVGAYHKVPEHRGQEGLEPGEQGEVPSVEPEVEVEPLGEVDEGDAEFRDDRQAPLQGPELEPDSRGGRDALDARSELDGFRDGAGGRGEECGEGRGARGGAEGREGVDDELDR